MNWVGGSRTRVLIKQEKRKPKSEYFEKKRLKSKMKLLGVLSPVKNSTVSLDLLNLYMVNHISCQKKTPETVRKPIHVNMHRDIKMPLRKHDLELPVSPHSVPSKLCIDDLENKLDNKKELAPIQLSQVMDSQRIFEPQFNRTENCTFTPSSFAAELSSNRNITKQNFIPRTAPSPQKVACEKKQNEQLSKVNYSNTLVSKLNESQDALSPSYKTAQFGSLFNRLNSSRNRNFPTRRPVRVMDEDCRRMDEQRQSDFITEKQSAQHIWREKRREVSNFFEDVNQPTTSCISENCNSFINENVISLLNINQQRIKKTIDKCGHVSIGDDYANTSSDKNYSTDRCIRSIFTDPELTFSNSFNETNYPERCQPNEKYQKEYNNNERNTFTTSFEKDCYIASSENKGKFESDYQEKSPQNEIQKHPVNHTSNISSEELHSKTSWDLEFDKILVEEGGTCSIKDRPTSTKKIYLDSSQSSHSTSYYSPRPTDSCFSSSSEVPSEDEDQILQHVEESSRSIRIKETTSNVYLERMPKLPCDRIIKNNAKTHEQNENLHHLSMKNNTD
ncbi:uncharacterized protein C12orf40-like, partial [Suricata suricatta]|uniref:uncharacterized protein C12orf40-like n=1 Tax=Suricata suricatta TaxID=37032 RepID=UPI001155E7E2